MAVKAAVCLQAQGIEDDDRGVGGVIQARILSDNGGGVGGGRGIDDASKGLEITTEVAGARRWSRGIYDNAEASAE